MLGLWFCDLWLLVWACLLKFDEFVVEFFRSGVVCACRGSWRGFTFEIKPFNL